MKTFFFILYVLFLSCFLLADSTVEQQQNFLNGNSDKKTLFQKSLQLKKDFFSQYIQKLLSDKNKSLSQALQYLQKYGIIDSQNRIVYKISPDLRIAIYNYLGVIAARNGFDNDAKNFYEYALKEISKTDDIHQLKTVLENYAASLIRSGQYDKAAEYFKLLSEIYVRTGEDLPAALKNNIGTNEFMQGNYTLALKNHLAAMEAIFKEKEILGEYDLTYVYNVAWDYCALSKQGQAVDFLLSVSRKIPAKVKWSFECRLIYLQAMISPIPDVEKKLLDLEQIRESDSDANKFLLLARSEIAKRCNQWEQVAEYLIEALNLQHPELLMQPIVKNLPPNLQVFQIRCMAIAHAFSKANNLEKAWCWIQRANIHSENELIVRGHTGKLLSIFEAEAPISLSEQKAEDIVRIEQAYEAAKKDLKDSNPLLWQALFSQRINIHPDDLDQIRHSLPDESALLETAVLGDNIVFFICEKSKPVKMMVYPCKNANKKIKKLILQFRQSMASPVNEEHAKIICNNLYEILFKPVSSEISRINPKLVLYSPSGILRYIPLAVLHTGKMYLCQKYLLCNISGYDLLRINQIENNTPLNRFVGFANPDGSLPDSEKECETIKNLFSSGFVYWRQQATKKQFLQLNGDIDCIHIATHGVLNPNIPEKSYLLFADKPLEYTEMAAGLPLMKHLYILTLSACNTASVTSINENAMEIYGIAYQFIRKSDAGATLATLWPISDTHTNQFMGMFYEALLKGKKQNMIFNRANALTQIQRKMLQQAETSHPFYWAPFILIGNFK